MNRQSSIIIFNELQSQYILITYHHPISIFQFIVNKLLDHIMGCTCVQKNGTNLKFSSTKEAIKELKSLRDDQFLHMMNQYVTINSLQLYDTILKNFNNCAAQQQFKRRDQRVSDPPADCNYLNYHMQKILSEYAFFMNCLEKMKVEKQTVSATIKKMEENWVKEMRQLLAQQPKKIANGMDLKNEELISNKSIQIKNSFYENEEKSCRISQCMQKIERSFKQKEDLQPNQLEQIILIQTQKSKMLIRDQDIKIRQICEQNQRLLQQLCTVNNQKREIKSHYDELSKQYSEKLMEKNKKIENLQKSLQEALMKMSKLSEQMSNHSLIKDKNTDFSEEIPYSSEGGSNLLKEQSRPRTKTIENKNLIEAILSMTFQSERQVRKQESKKSSSFIFRIFGQSEVLCFQKYKIAEKYRQIIVEMFPNKIIQKTEKIFQYDNLTKNNVFHYIGNKENLVLLVKLKNGVVIGGYSKINFKENIENMEGNEAFIFSISSPTEHYQMSLKEESLAKYSVKIDDNFLKFGANEIRIRCESNQGFANICGSASIFNCPKQSMSFQKFLKLNDRRFVIENYEVHQLIFKDGNCPENLESQFEKSECERLQE